MLQLNINYFLILLSTLQAHVSGMQIEIDVTLVKHRYQGIITTSRTYHSNVGYRCLLHKPAMEITSKLALIRVFSIPHLHIGLAQVVRSGGFPLLCPSH